MNRAIRGGRRWLLTFRSDDLVESSARGREDLSNVGRHAPRRASNITGTKPGLSGS